MPRRGDADARAFLQVSGSAWDAAGRACRPHRGRPPSTRQTERSSRRRQPDLPEYPVTRDAAGFAETAAALRAPPIARGRRSPGRSRCGTAAPSRCSRSHPGRHGLLAGGAPCPEEQYDVGMEPSPGESWDPPTWRRTPFRAARRARPGRVDQRPASAHHRLRPGRWPAASSQPCLSPSSRRAPLSSRPTRRRTR
jgi:hypothetical protein